MANVLKQLKLFFHSLLISLSELPDTQEPLTTALHIAYADVLKGLLHGRPPFYFLSSHKLFILENIEKPRAISKQSFEDLNKPICLY